VNVSAVIVTRGNVDLGACLAPILAAGVDEIIIRRGHGGVWERYEGAREARYAVIYTQDDDCTVDVGQVIEAYAHGVVTCNMPASRRAEYNDGIALVGWGCVFHRSALDVLPRLEPQDDLERREADRVFTGLNDLKLIDVPFRHLPWALGKDRMGREARHGDDLREIRRRIYAARQGVTK
jgi:hypothetical protein